MNDPYTASGSLQRSSSTTTESTIPPGANPRTIYGKGATFTLDSFSSRDFIVKDFIENLTEAAQPSTRRSLGPPTGPSNFDAKPLIRAFEQARRRLNDLSQELEQKETELSGAVRRAEAQHASNTESLGRRLKQTVVGFQTLDRKIKDEQGVERWGGNIAIDTGKKLEELDRQRQRVLDAHFLIECWDEVSNRGELTLLENLRRTNTGESKIRSAHIAKQLLRISQRLEDEPKVVVNGTGKQLNGETNGNYHAKRFNTREVIEKFIETLEKDMLDVFDECWRRKNYDEMRSCAVILQDFHDGASVQAVFVNQHPFFIDRSNLVTDEIAVDPEAWVRLSDPDANLPGTESGLQSLIDEVRVVVQEESAIIKKAFPYPEQVLGKFVQRIFQQSIQQRLEIVLEKAESESTLAYLRSLQAARGSISALVDDLKAHGLTEHPDPVTSQTSQLLDQQIDELFTPYFGGTAYIDRERQNLRELYKSLLFKFELFHTRRQKEPKTYLASLRNRGQELLSSAREATDAYVKSLDLEKMSSTQKRILLSVAGLKSTDKAAGDMELSEEDGRLSTAYAKRMLKWLAEGVRRSLELAGNSETSRDISALQSLLLSTVGEHYVEMALEAAADAASTAEAAKREQPDLGYLGQLKVAISVMYLLQSCINTLLLPLASSALTVRRDMDKVARVRLMRMEDQINTIEQRTIDAVLNWTARLLTNQARPDFRPRDESEAALASSSTPTCASVLKFLNHFHTLATSTFDGGNRIALLTEVAIEFRGQLLEHFRKYQVNRLGAVMLIRDISAYIDLLKSWDLGTQFNVTLEILSEIGGLFVLRPEAVRDRLRGQVLSGVKKEELRTYLVKREDYMDVGMQSLLHSM